MTWIKANKQWMGFTLAIVAALGVGGAGVGAAERFVFSKHPDPPTTVDITAAVQQAVASAMQPYQQALTEVRLAAEEAKNIAQTANRTAASAKEAASDARELFRELNSVVRVDLKSIVEDMGKAKVDIATLLERTRPRVPG